VLILTRRSGENIIVGDDIVISVIEVRGDAVRIGITAPRTVSVHREEVYRELQVANQRAASSPDEAIEDILRQAKPKQSGKAPKRPGAGEGPNA
jgi:carbon storage regulator